MSTPPTPLFECNFQLGDNPGAFPASTYIGLKLSLPVKVVSILDAADSVHFVVSTSDLETWGDWEGHKVSVNGSEIGRLNDALDGQGSPETFDIGCPKADFLALLGGANSFELEIELQRKLSAPGLSDDFILCGISVVGAEFKVG